eukprot:873706_1
MGSCGSQCDRLSHKPTTTNTDNPDSLVFKQQRRRNVNCKQKQQKMQILLNDKQILNSQSPLYSKETHGEQLLNAPNLEHSCSISSMDSSFNDNNYNQNNNDLYQYDSTSKSLKLNVNKLIGEKITNAPNLFRPDTETPWDFSDMDELENEIKEQIQTLEYNNDEEGLPDAIKMNHSSSSLYRQESRDK